LAQGSARRRCRFEIEGSARVRLEDGTLLRLAYDGAPTACSYRAIGSYAAIGRVLAERNLIPRPRESRWIGIKRWMQANSRASQGGCAAPNRSLVFFRITGLDYGGRTGRRAGECRLSPGRSNRSRSPGPCVWHTLLHRGGTADREWQTRHQISAADGLRRDTGLGDLSVPARRGYLLGVWRCPPAGLRASSDKQGRFAMLLPPRTRYGFRAGKSDAVCRKP